VLLAASLGFAALLFFSSRIERVYERFAQRFLLSLSESDLQVVDVSPEPVPAGLSPWDAHLAVFEVSYDSVAAGKTVADLQIRSRYGVTVTLIERGDRRIPVPERTERVFPRDRLHAIGTDEELAAFQEFIEVAPASPIDDEDEADYGLDSVTVSGKSKLVGKRIGDSGIRERASGLVVGVERLGERILNPPVDFKIQSGDILWIVGQSEKVRALET
jgi:CPA2 family monovalent cation:H+ antiporter-2